MLKIVITNLFNKSSESEMLQLEALTSSITNAEYIILPENNKPYTRLNSVWATVKMLFSIKSHRQVRNSDIVISQSGDVFSDSPSIAYSLLSMANLLPAIIHRKPYILCSQTIGEFKTPFTLALAKYVMHRAKAISVRDPLSKEYLTKLGINSKLYNDMVYLVATERSKLENIIVINTWSRIYKYMKVKRDEYINIIVDVAKELRRYGNIVLVTHTTDSSDEEHRLATDICSLVKGSMIGGSEYLSRGKLVIGSKMHACVRAINSGIPTLVLGYSRKYSGVPELSWTKVTDVRGISVSNLKKSILKSSYKLLSVRPDYNDILNLRKSARGHIDVVVNSYKEISLLGNYEYCGLSVSTNRDVMLSASSGGTVTELLYSAINDGYDGALCICNGELVVCNTKQQLIKSSGSDYMAYDYKRMLEMVDSGRHLAVVGLPCQISHLKNMYPDNLYVGLFCCHRIDSRGIDYVKKLLGVDGKLIKYKYRLNGNNGLMIDNKVFVPRQQYWSKFFNYCFVPKQCMNCHNHTAEDADISVGDAWGYGYKNVVIVRTDRGGDLVNRVVDDGRISLQNIKPKQLINTQSGFIQYKKGQYPLKMLLYHQLRSMGCYISDKPALQPLMRLWFNLVTRKVELNGKLG